MIIINLGFPKTSSTNLQTHFYPNLKNIKYFGRNYKEKDLKLFNELNDFIENRRKFLNSDLNNLIRNFKSYCKKHKKVLISHERWAMPFHKNLLTQRYEIVHQEIKLNNLLFILNKTNIPYKFFFIQRDLNDSITSLFVTHQDSILYLFGEKFLSFEFFLDYIDKKKINYKNLLSLLETYSLKKITKIIPKNKICLFNYEDLLNNKERFINDLSNYLEIDINYNLINKLSIYTNTSSRNKKGEYQIQSRNKLFNLLKFLIPNFLMVKLRFLLKNQFVRILIFKNIKVKKDNNVLKKIINEYF